MRDVTCCSRACCTVLYCTVLYCNLFQSMLTPRFSLSQDAEFLTVTIYAPFTHIDQVYCTVLYCTVLYCNVLYCTVLYAPFTHIDQTEIFMEGGDFRFYSPPYFLRLHLPGQVGTVLYCVLYCTTVLYCTVLYCIPPPWPGGGD